MNTKKIFIAVLAGLAVMGIMIVIFAKSGTLSADTWIEAKD